MSDQLLLAGLPTTPIRRGNWITGSGRRSPLMDPHSEIPGAALLPAGFGPGQLWWLGEALQSLREQGIGILAPVPSPTTCAPSGPGRRSRPRGRASSPAGWSRPWRRGQGSAGGLPRPRPGRWSPTYDDHLRPLFVALGPPAPTGPGSCTTAGTTAASTRGPTGSRVSEGRDGVSGGGQAVDRAPLWGDEPK